MSDIRYALKLDSSYNLTCLLIGPKDRIIKETRKAIFKKDEQFIEDWVHLSLKQALDNGTKIDDDNYAIELDILLNHHSMLSLFCWLKGLTKQPIEELSCEPYPCAAQSHQENAGQLGFAFTYNADGFQISYVTLNPADYVNHVIAAVNQYPGLLTKYEDVLTLEDVLPNDQHHFWLDDELENRLEERKQAHAELLNKVKKPPASFFSKESSDVKKRIKHYQKHLEIKVEDLMFTYTGVAYQKETTLLLRQIAYAIEVGMELVFAKDERLKPYNPPNDHSKRQEGVLIDTQELPLDRHMILTNQVIYTKDANGKIEQQALTSLKYLAKADMPKLANMANQYLALDKKLKSFDEPPVNKEACSIV